MALNRADHETEYEVKGEPCRAGGLDDEKGIVHGVVTVRIHVLGQGVVHVNVLRLILRQSLHAEIADGQQDHDYVDRR